MKQYLESNSISNESIERLSRDISISAHSRDVNIYAIPVAEGFIALNSNNQELWSEAIAKTLENHVSETKTGELKTDYEGFICLSGLALIKLGLDKGWRAHIDSPYLPTALMASQ